MCSRPWVLVLAALLMIPAALHAGSIQGRILTTPIPPQSKGKKSSSETSPADKLALSPQRQVVEAVVYLERIPEKVERKLTRQRWWKRQPRLPRMVQQELRFTPRVLATAAGSRVEFANLDRVFHNTFSVSAARRFDLGKYPPGHVDTIAFERAGVANLHCDIHPRETAFVVVVPNHAYARPDSFGRFSLPKLPAGVYTVRVWHPRLGDLRRKVTMPRRGDLALEFNYR